MSNIWILTEEYPKISSIVTILRQFSIDFNFPEIKIYNPRIVPIYKKNRVFSFEYKVTGVSINNVFNITICCVSGKSSFCDYLVFYQDNKPENSKDIPLMVIEETKTSDGESRNSSIYQRGIKFVYAKLFYPETQQYMIYHNNSYNYCYSPPSDTNIFGTNIFLTLGIKIISNNYDRNIDYYRPFTSYNELIEFKNNMKPTKNGITTKIDNTNPNQIKMSIRLEKNNNMSHDPGIGTLAIITYALRKLGYRNTIIITQHGITQDMVNTSKGNKLLYICFKLGIQLEGINIPPLIFPDTYWQYERNSEKITSIFLHVIAENHGFSPIFHNHAGCEKSYFISNYGSIPLNKNVKLPDIVFYDKISRLVTIIESKKFKNINQGISELNNYDQIKNMYIFNSEIGYPKSYLYSALSIFGDSFPGIPNDMVLIYIDKFGNIYVNEKAPFPWICIFNNENLL